MYILRHAKNAKFYYCSNLQAPLFHNVDSGFMRMLSLVIDPVFYLPGQIIASKGEIGHHMFYIHRGKAEVGSCTSSASICGIFGTCATQVYSQGNLSKSK